MSESTKVVVHYREIEHGDYRFEVDITGEWYDVLRFCIEHLTDNGTAWVEKVKGIDSGDN